MSLARLVYYSAVIGGWAALLGWLLSELLFFRSGSASGRIVTAMVGAIVGAAIGAGLSLVAGMANAQWKQLLVRAGPGLICGALGGALGSSLGEVLYELAGLPRAVGWAAVGLGIGVADGAYERSKDKIRNGLVGGALGGFVGGMLFDPIQRLMASGSGMSSRATAFVILGICIGAMIGLAQVVLKHAWLTVLDGYRTGRQLILGQATTLLGRAEHLPLPFLGSGSQDLELEHVRIVRQNNGSFTIEDNHTRLGTFVNNQPLHQPVRLNDGDVIKLGRNLVRFNERQRRADESPPAVPPAAARSPAVPPPPKKASLSQPASKLGTPAAPADSQQTNDRPEYRPQAPASSLEKRRGPPPPPAPPPKPKH